MARIQTHTQNNTKTRRIIQLNKLFNVSGLFNKYVLRIVWAVSLINVWRIQILLKHLCSFHYLSFGWIFNVIWNLKIKKMFTMHNLNCLPGILFLEYKANEHMCWTLKLHLIQGWSQFVSKMFLIKQKIVWLLDTTFVKEESVFNKHRENIATITISLECVTYK